MSKSSAEQLITLIVHKASLISELLDDISLKRFPSKNPEILIKIIRGICDALRDHTLDIGEDATSLETEEVVNELKLILYKLVTIAPDIRFIEGSSVERTPWSLVQPFENFSQKIHQDTPIILRPQWHYNFAIRRSLLNEYRLSLQNVLREDTFKNLFRDMPKEIYVISFPSIEKPNILLQSILGHELGHPLATDYLNQEDEAAYLPIIADEVDNILPSADALEKEKKRSALVHIVQKIRNNSLSEIVSDVVAVHLFGFSVIFSAYEIAIMLSMDDIPADERPGRDYYYPPWRYRIRQMLAELDWPKCDKKMQEVVKENPDFEKVYSKIAEKMKHLSDIVAERKDLENIESRDSYRIAYNSIEIALPLVKDFINDKLKDYTEISIRNIFHLSQRLRYDLPPNAIEIESPFNPEIPVMPEIINAGWFYRVAYLDENITKSNYKEYLNNIEILNRLIFKALELSDVSTKYNNEKGPIS